MGRPKWGKGEHLYNLINYPISKLEKIYRDYTKGSLSGKKAYWKEKVMSGAVAMPKAPEQNRELKPETVKSHDIPYAEQIPEDAIVNWHVGYIKNSEGEIEYTKPLPSVHTGHLAKPNVEFDQAVAAKITPSTVKPKVRNHKILVVFSDAQVDFRRLPDNTLDPIHDEQALSVMHQIAKDLQPDEIINTGDTVDLSALSRFKPDSDHFHRTLGPSFQRVHDMYAQLRSDVPNARIVEVDSNHNTRLKNFMLKYAPDLYGVKRAGDPEDEYPMFTYPYLTNLNKLDVKWVSGYGAARYIYGDKYGKPPIEFKHGNIMASGGSTAVKESKMNPETHVVRGHGHRVERHTRTTRSGNYLTSLMIGTVCKITGEVPSYHSAVDDHGYVVNQNEDWQQSVLVIYDYNGEYQFDNILISKGKAFYKGKEYEA